MRNFETVLHAIDGACRCHNMPYLIIGGFANILHGSSRTNRDIELVVFLEFEEIDKLVEFFLEEFKPRIQDPLPFLRKNYVLPLRHNASQIEVDISVGLSGFENRALSRAQRIEVHGMELPVCSVEDLILFKLVAARPRDLLDVQELVQRFYPGLDVSYLHEAAKDFLDVERSDVLDNLRRYLPT